MAPRNPDNISFIPIGEAAGGMVLPRRMIFNNVDFDGLVKSLKTSFSDIPAKAGIQG